MKQDVALLRRYDGLRHAQRRLHSEALAFLSRRDILEGAKELGMVDGDRLVFGSEHEMAVTMDHCLYDLRRNGGNAIERYLAQNRFEAASPEFELAAAMPHARCSIFVIEGVYRGDGLGVRDLLRQEPVRLLDRQLSETAEPGMTLVTRVLLFDDFGMTTGAGLPFDSQMAEELRHRASPWLQQEARKGLDIAHMTAKQQARFATFAIRAALDLGAGDYVDSQ